LIDGSAERDAAFERLREAYMDLEAAKPLRELGRSAAFINHELKNCMMVISGYAALLLRSKNLDKKDRAMAESIAAAVAKLHDFSMSVLELSSPKAASGEEEIELAKWLRQRIDVNFPERASDISVTCTAPQNTVLLNGNPEKLERALVNALQNSFEAGARNVSVKLSACNQITLIVIEDDGAGCSAEHLQNLSTTFFTTKRGVGTGLGLCVIRSIVEAHNGCVSIYAKNVLGGGKHGLSMQILLPASKNTPCEAAKAEVMLVKDGLPGIQKIMKTLKELKITPRIAEQVSEIGNEGQNSLLDLIIIASASKAEELRGLTKGNGKIKILPIEETDTGVLLVTDVDSTNINVSNKELLTEEYIINHLLN
jgi:two-component sensor histidine kinase